MAIAGKDGKVMVGANVIAEITNWSLDIGLDAMDVTALQASGSWKQFLAGLKEWSGSAEGNWDVATDVNGQAALQNAILNGTTVDLKLYVNSTNYYSGTAIITSQSVESAVDSPVTISFEFQGTGALTYA